MSQAMDHLKQLVARFLQSCGADYEFPAGGEIGLLTDPELTLAKELQSSRLSDEQQISAMIEGHGWNDCYSIAIFAVRLAIQGVRTGNLAMYKSGVKALAAGAPKVDWRDLLGALAIFENCGNRLEIDFRTEFEAIAKFSDETKLLPVFDGYFSRSDDMRGVDVMGIVESGSDSQLMFRSKPVS